MRRSLFYHYHFIQHPPEAGRAVGLFGKEAGCREGILRAGRGLQLQTFPIAEIFRYLRTWLVKINPLSIFPDVPKMCRYVSIW